MSLLAAALPVVGNLISGLFGSKKQSTTSEIDYVKMRENAEKAGFNPLTALRAGGGAGFTTTHHPALSAASFIGDAIGGLGNVIASIDPMRDATAKLEFQIKQETLKNLQADTAARNRASLGGVPVSTGARNVVVGSKLATGAPVAPSVETPTLTNPHPVSSGWQIDPDQPDAEMYETRYGDSEIWNTIDGTKIRVKDWVYGHLKQTERDVQAAKKDYSAAIERKRISRQQLRKNESFFKRNGY